ncbi:hypothetical protein DFH27DRAFT_159934 [Peziza echinospora]|nr:hypothetical protein DFH27DRAFT_159934 [Peziza echinospora]
MNPTTQSLTTMSYLWPRAYKNFWERVQICRDKGTFLAASLQGMPPVTLFQVCQVTRIECGRDGMSMMFMGEKQSSATSKRIVCERRRVRNCGANICSQAVTIPPAWNGLEGGRAEAGTDACTHPWRGKSSAASIGKAAGPADIPISGSQEPAYRRSLCRGRGAKAGGTERGVAAGEGALDLEIWLSRAGERHLQVIDKRPSNPPGTAALLPSTASRPTRLLRLLSHDGQSQSCGQEGHG